MKNYKDIFKNQIKEQIRKLWNSHALFLGQKQGNMYTHKNPKTEKGRKNFLHIHLQGYARIEDGRTDLFHWDDAQCVKQLVLH